MTCPEHVKQQAHNLTRANISTCRSLKSLNFTVTHLDHISRLGHQDCQGTYCIKIVIIFNEVSFVINKEVLVIITNIIISIAIITISTLIMTTTIIKIIIPVVIPAAILQPMRPSPLV